MDVAWLRAALSFLRKGRKKKSKCPMPAPKKTKHVSPSKRKSGAGSYVDCVT